MTYDPVAYWQAAGSDPQNPEHESQFVRTPVFARQEERLMATLEGLEFGSVLEVGCGWGRITSLVHDRWPEADYLAVDISKERIASARKKAPGVTFKVQSLFEVGADTAEYRQWDLVLAVETLMHIPPEDIAAAVEALCSLSSRYVVSLDWSADLGARPIAPWNTRFDYPALYGDRLRTVEATDLQSIYVADVRSPEAKEAAEEDAP